MAGCSGTPLAQKLGIRSGSRPLLMDPPPEFDATLDMLPEGGRTWRQTVQRTSGVPTDLNENVLRDTGLPTGMVDNKVCAIDQTWSGLRFVVRRRTVPPGRVPGH